MNIKVNNGMALELVNSSGLAPFVTANGGSDVPSEVVEKLLSSNMAVLLYWKNLNGMKVWRLNQEEIWGTVGMSTRSPAHDPVCELCEAAGLISHNAQYEDIVMANYDWQPHGILGQAKKKAIHMAFQRTKGSSDVGVLMMAVEEALDVLMSELEDQMDLVVYMQ